MSAWSFDRDGTYFFNFSPSRDDFSQVKVGAGWSLDPSHALQGNEFACCFADALTFAKLSTADAGGSSGGDAWLFSAPFEFRAGELYEAGLKYKAIAPDVGQPPRLTLRLGTGQTSSMQQHRLLEFTVSNSGVDVLRSTFQVPADGTYYFSLEGQPGSGVVALGANAAGLAGKIGPF